MSERMEFPTDAYGASSTGMGWTVTRDDGTVSTCHVTVEWVFPWVYRLSGTATNPGPDVESHGFGPGLVFGTYRRAARKADEMLRALAPTEVLG